MVVLAEVEAQKELRELKWASRHRNWRTFCHCHGRGCFGLVRFADRLVVAWCLCQPAVVSHLELHVQLPRLDQLELQGRSFLSHQDLPELPLAQMVGLKLTQEEAVA